MIQQISGILEARIARERGKPVERTAGHSNDKEALKWEFGMGPGPVDSNRLAVSQMREG